MMTESKMIRMIAWSVAGCISLFGMAGRLSAESAGPATKWSEEKAWEWYAKQPWLFGCNFLPSTAVNDTEMWQAETFDPKTIDRELAWAHQLGYNSCRVFIQYIVWKQDPKGFKNRFDQFLSIAEKHKISVMPIPFDDCASMPVEPLSRKAGRPGTGDIQRPLGAEPRAEAGYG